MICVFCLYTMVKRYKPLAINRKIQGFFLAKQGKAVFKEYFKGEFDNQIQTIIDIKISDIKSSWYLHEHIHCSITKQKYISKDKGLLHAIYYFPFKTSILFRDRIYFFYPSIFSTKQKIIFQMEILQNNLKKNLLYNLNTVKTDFLPSENYDFAEDLIRCTILWSLSSGQKIFQKDYPIFIGELINGGSSIFSFTSFEFLHVKDNLILSEYALWVNDRGFTNREILKYGNLKNFSYRMERISIKNQLNCTLRNIKKKYK